MSKWWRNRFLIWVPVTLLVFTALQGLIVPYHADAASDKETAVQKAVDYLVSVQHSDGGFGLNDKAASDPMPTAWVVMALGTLPYKDANVSAAIKAGEAYLGEHLEELNNTTDRARALLGQIAANPGKASKDVVQTLKLQRPDGQLAQPGEEELINAHIWASLALRSAGAKIADVNAARNWLISKQNRDGGFSFGVGLDSDLDDTAAAVQALLAIGSLPSDPEIRKARAYMQQVLKGALSAPNGVNSANLAWTLQAVTALRESPEGAAWRAEGKTIASRLLALQHLDGSFAWKEGAVSNPVLVTSYAVMALSGRFFPFDHHTGSEPDWRDMPESHWAHIEAVNATRSGWVSGYSDNTFRPNQPVTRAEFISMLLRARGTPLLSAETSRAELKGFQDIASDHWAYRAVATAVAAGWLHGKSATAIAPNGTITGAEMMAVLVQLSGSEVKPSTGGQPWYLPFTQAARQSHILYPRFSPEAGATRAQAVYAISAALER